MSVDINTFERLRLFVIETRMAKGLSQRDVADAGGIPVGTIANMESGTRPSIPRQETIAGIARGLDLPYEVLDRIARGLPPKPDDEASLIAVMLESASPRAKRILLAYLSADKDRRQAFDAGLEGIARALGLDPH